MIIAGQKLLIMGDRRLASGHPPSPEISASIHRLPHPNLHNGSPLVGHLHGRVHSADQVARLLGHALRHASLPVHCPGGLVQHGGILLGVGEDVVRRGEVAVVHHGSADTGVGGHHFLEVMGVVGHSYVVGA